MLMWQFVNKIGLIVHNSAILLPLSALSFPDSGTI